MRSPDRAPLSPPASPDTLPDDPTQDDSEQSPADQQNRLRDAEILGKSVKVRLAIDMGVTKAIAGTHESVAKFKNMLSSPKNTYLRRRQEAADDKYQRKLGNVGNSHSKFINRIHQNTANRAKNKLDKRTEKYNSHNSLMQGRLDKVQGIRDRHESIHSRKIEAFRDRKEMAKGRKEIRHLRNQIRDRGMNRSEVNRLIQGISPEARKRAGAIACQKEVAERGMKSLARARNKAERKASGANDRLDAVRESLEMKEEVLSRASARRDSAEELRGDFSSKITELTAERDSLNPDNEEDAERLLEIDDELLKEENGLASAEQQIQAAENDVATLTESITYLTNEERALAANHDKLDRRAQGLNSKHTKQREAIADLDHQQRNAFRTSPEPEPTPTPPPPPADPVTPPPAPYPVAPPTPPDNEPVSPPTPPDPNTQP